MSDIVPATAARRARSDPLENSVGSGRKRLTKIELQSLTGEQQRERRKIQQRKRGPHEMMMRQFESLDRYGRRSAKWQTVISNAANYRTRISLVPTA